MYIHLRNYCKAYAFFSIGQIEPILDFDVDSDFDIIGRQCLGVLVCCSTTFSGKHKNIRSVCWPNKNYMLKYIRTFDRLLSFQNFLF